VANLHAPADDQLYLATGTASGLGVYRKAARDVTAGEFVWSFVVDAYAPEIRGHFEFVPVTAPATLSSFSARGYRWFNHSDGPYVTIPDDWALLEGSTFFRASTRRSYKCFAYPGFLYDKIPLALGFELFSNGFQSDLLTEAAAYFLGAFCVRPQMQTIGADTWGMFGTTINPSGSYGTSNRAKHTQLGLWLSSQRVSFEKLAYDVWGAGNFISEQSGNRLGLPNIGVPITMRGNKYLARSDGFSIHAPIAKQLRLNSVGNPSDPDLRLVQYWYSCIRSNLLERTTTSVKKAFLLGALDTVSNADSSRRSIGFDFNDDFAGEFPFYSTLHEVGELLLPTFEGDETGNPRFSGGRMRGRIPRCRIYDAAERIGFLSGMRFNRAKDYEPDIASIQSPTFPTPDVLSVILGVPVYTVSQPTNFGSNESDLTAHKLFQSDAESVTLEMACLSVNMENCFAVCSLPVGTFTPSASIATAAAKASQLSLALGGWKADALEKLGKINDYLPALSPNVPADMTFEYLVALLASKLDGCVDSWVIPRSEDQGVDVGAMFMLGVGLGTVTAVFQAKLQSTRVGRRIVDMLRGALFREKSQIGYVVTSNDFTARARRSAEQDHPEIRLINGEKLVELMLVHGIGLFSKGTGPRRKVFVDLTFMEKARQLAVTATSTAGRIRVCVNEFGDPAFRT